MSTFPDMLAAVLSTGPCDSPVFLGNNLLDSAIKERSKAMTRIQNPIITFTQYSNLSAVGCGEDVVGEVVGFVAGSIHKPVWQEIVSSVNIKIGN